MRSGRSRTISRTGNDKNDPEFTKQPNPEPDRTHQLEMVPALDPGINLAFTAIDAVGGYHHHLLPPKSTQPSSFLHKVLYILDALSLFDSFQGLRLIQGISEVVLICAETAKHTSPVLAS